MLLNLLLLIIFFDIMFFKIITLLFSFLICSTSYSNDEKITVGISADYPPFDMMINGKVDGFDADIANEIGKILNKKIIIKEIDFSNLIPSINSKVIDIAISNISATNERKKTVDFSIPYFKNEAVIIYNNKNEYKNINSITPNKVIGVQLGSVFEDFAKNNFPNNTVSSLNKLPILLEEFLLERIDYVIFDSIQAEFFIKKHPQYKMSLLENFNGDISIALEKKSHLTNDINNAIQELFNNGTIEKLKQKWLVDYSLNTEEISKNNMLIKNSIFIVSGISVTIFFAFSGSIFGFLIGLSLTFLSNINSKLKCIVNVYISLLRGTPIILQLSILYFIIPKIIGSNVSIYWAGIIGFSLNSAAYIFEHIKAGIKAIDKGQLDAATALGISNKTINKIIILPQAIRNITPSIINEFINLVKETSIISVFGVSDIMRRANIVASEQYDFLSSLLIAGACYYILITSLTIVLNIVEKKLGK
jgi:His/Glu/Gln/Arg/opine family amino acid ABC transporter permease subunit